MKKNIRKVIALALVLCSVVGLIYPAMPEASAEIETNLEALGEILRSDMNIPGAVEMAVKDGREYLIAPIKGGRLYVLSVTDYLEGKTNQQGNYIYDKVDNGINVPRGLAFDSQGNYYIAGDSSKVFWYNIHTGDSGNIETDASGLMTVCVDENDNVYIGGKVGNRGVIYKIAAGTKQAAELCRIADYTTVQAMAWGDGKLFAHGPVVNTVGTGSQTRMLTMTGELVSTYSTPVSGGSYYLSYIDGVVFYGLTTVATNHDGFVALDTADNRLTLLDMGKDTPILGDVSDPVNGKCYVVVQDDGIYLYDVATRTLGDRVNKSGRRPNRSQNPMIHYQGNTYMLSVGPSSVTTTAATVGGGNVALTDLLKDAFSSFSPRSITAGIDGTGVAVYVGAYLSGGVYSYSPDAETTSVMAFGNGHDQTDSLIAYKGKIYGGAYSGAYLFEYDPATGAVRQLIPRGLEAEGSGQRRIHALAVGDDKVFFATIPTDQQLGGVIGWYDLTNDTYYYERNVVEDQAAITIAYDEKTNILYGGTTIRGGTNTTPTTEQAMLFAYDVDKKALAASTTLGSLTGDLPRFISGIAQDPNTGKLWGLVAQTVFSFALENGEIKVTKEWAASSLPSNAYPDAASRSWFPQPILFDGRGNMYMTMLERKLGLMMFSLDEDNKIRSTATLAKNTTRVYTLGADGDMYYYDDQLYKIDMSFLDRACVVESKNDMTYTDLDTALAQAGAGDTIRLLSDAEQDVYVTGGATLDLNGKNITGNVRVVNGKLSDTVGSGTVTGSVSVPADNACMPLLVPGSGNVYKLFAYTPVSAARPKYDEQARGWNFWFDLDFEDEAAYELLRGESNLKVGATLSWTENGTTRKSVEVLFDNILDDWANADHSQNQGLYVQVTNIPDTGVTGITVTPWFEAEGTGLKVTMGSATRSDAKVDATAIFGTYPTDLIVKK